MPIVSPEIGGKTLFVDAHVHLHDCFDLGAALDAASRSFARLAQQIGAGAYSGCLLLAEGAFENAFERIGKHINSEIVDGWMCCQTDEEECLQLIKSDGAELLLVGGYQIVTLEKLEVLALGTKSRMVDGQPIDQVVNWYREGGALVIIPWGFGKWWFARGRIARELILLASNRGIFLGDNGGRLSWAWSPQLFSLGERRGLKILPGSDPLPFQSEAQRVGSYFFGLPDWSAELGRVKTLKARLQLMDRSPIAYGRRQNVLGFATAQFRMQNRKIRRLA